MLLQLHFQKNKNSSQDGKVIGPKGKKIKFPASEAGQTLLKWCTEFLTRMFRTAALQVELWSSARRRPRVSVAFSISFCHNWQTVTGFSASAHAQASPRPTVQDVMPYDATGQTLCVISSPQQTSKGCSPLTARLYLGCREKTN